VTELTKLLYPEEQLQVTRVQYGSPGFKDLTGAAEIVGHVKDFLLHIFDYCGNSRARHIKDDEGELRNTALRIANVRQYVQLGRELGYGDAELRELARYADDRQETFVGLIESGKLTAVQMLPPAVEDAEKHEE
jgi:hypothetical protein